MFEVDCGGDRFSDVTHLSDVELASRLRELGADIGPVNNATRNVYRRKLQRLLQNHNPRNHIRTGDNQEEPSLVVTRHLAFLLPAPDSNQPYRASLQQHERQADVYARKLADGATKNITRKESNEGSCDVSSPAAESLGQSARNVSPSRNHNGLRNRSHPETGGDDRLHESNRTKPDLKAEISSTSVRTSGPMVGPGHLQPELGSCLSHQVQEQQPKKPTISAVIFLIILLCFIFVLIIFNMEPEYRNPALL